MKSQSKIIHNQAAGFITIYAVDARNGLHESVPLHGFVNVHCVQSRDIKAGEPHITDDSKPEWVFWVFETVGKFFAAVFGANVALPFRISSATSHYNFYHALGVIIRIPVGAKFDDG